MERKSIWYEEMKETHNEEFIGVFDNLRNNDWIKSTDCPLTNRELKVVEKKLKKGEVFQSNGTFGTKSVFYFDKDISKFVGFLHHPKKWGAMDIRYLSV